MYFVCLIKCVFNVDPPLVFSIIFDVMLLQLQLIHTVDDTIWSAGNGKILFMMLM